MIGSFVLFVVLFGAASLGWGLMFHSNRAGLSRRVLLLAFFFVTASSVLASLFFLKGLGEAGNTVAQLTSSLTFALSLVLSIFLGFSLTAFSDATALFSSLEGLWKGEGKEQDKSSAVDGILERITETGEIDAFEKELIESILKFNDKIVREVMIPRGDIVAINLEEEPRRVLRRVAEEGYSRMPVFSGSIDNIVGIIYAKDLIPMAEGGGAIVLQDILRPPYYVPESKKISQLLREMQRNKVHLAVVVDEFGGTEGIVTLEDVLEEIVGEIQDEYDESLSELVRDQDGDIHFSGSMTVDRFNELLDCDIPREEDYDTMAGFVQKIAGKLPQKGEIYTHGEMIFIIEEVARHRIKRLKVSYREHPPLAQTSESAEVPPQTAGQAMTANVSRTILSEPRPAKGGARKPRAKSGTRKKSVSPTERKGTVKPRRGGRGKR
jgi:CBS domain containing-hemolysin-like protein